MTEILFLRKKKQEALEKKLGSKFIRINTSKENYDADQLAEYKHLSVNLRTDN